MGQCILSSKFFADTIIFYLQSRYEYCYQIQNAEKDYMHLLFFRKRDLFLFPFTQEPSTSKGHGAGAVVFLGSMLLIIFAIQD